LRYSVIGLLTGLLCCGIARATADDGASFKTLRLEGNGVRWQLAAKGQQRVLSYAVVKEDMVFAGARNCGKMTRLNDLLSASGIQADTLRTEITAAFAMWETAANIGFREADTPATADILIGAQLEPEGWAFANVFYDTLSPEPELVQDLLAIVHVFSARLSGLRSYQQVIRDAALHQDQTPEKIRLQKRSGSRSVRRTPRPWSSCRASVAASTTGG